MGPVLLRSKHVIGKCPQRRASQHLRLDPGRQHFEEGTNPICSMVLEYAHQHLPWKSPSFVGKYSIHEAYGNATSLPFCPTNVGENRGDWTTSSLRRIPSNVWLGWWIIIPFLQLNIKTILKTNNMLETIYLYILYFPILYPQSIPIIEIPENHRESPFSLVKSR